MVNWYRAMIESPSEPPASFDVNIPMIFLWGMKDIALLHEMADDSMVYCKQGKLIKFPKQRTGYSTKKPKKSIN